MIRFIRGSREAMNKKRKFDGVRAQASHGGSWDRSRYAGYQVNSKRYYLFFEHRLVLMFPLLIPEIY